MAKLGRLEGLRCVIVGGTGGIGLASARRFLEEGARIVVSGSPDQGGAVADSGLDSFGQIVEFTADVREACDVASLFAFAFSSLAGRIDVLLHVAGISGRRFGDGPLHECSDDGWDRVFQVNARGAFLCNREAVQIMRSQSRDQHGLRGSVLNVGTVSDRSFAIQHFDTIAYAASKAALRALTLGSAARYASEGIRFNLIEPALIDTPMAARAVQDESMRPYLRSKMPLTDGPLSPLDVAEAAVDLASAAAKARTGTVLTVDGGWCLSEGRSGD
jgi:NAD(P)-dependent dehydrogenase (short-subunit alcohol dehydrogenase family)